jgi:hypothetical protein
MIFAAFLDSPDAVQNPATIQSGGSQKRLQHEPFGVIFSDSRVSPPIIEEKSVSKQGPTCLETSFPGPAPRLAPPTAGTTSALSSIPAPHPDAASAAGSSPHASTSLSDAPTWLPPA